MTPERLRQIEELYHAAREGAADERAALLAQADPELRREVESLFAERTGDEFLDRPAIQNAPELLEDATVTAVWLRASAWDRTGLKAGSARAVWARCFAPSTRD